MLKKLLIALVVLVLLVGAGVGALWWAYPPERLLALAEQKAGEALGTPIKVGAVRWALQPTPQLVVEQMSTPALKAPLSVQRVTLVPKASALMAGRLEMALIQIDGARLPQDGISELAAMRRAARAKEGAGKDGKDPKGPRGDGGAGSNPPAIDAIVLRKLVWRSPQGLDVQVDADAQLTPQSFVLQALTVKLAGGESTGSGQLVWTGLVAAPDAANLALALKTRGVRVEALHPKSKVAGSLDADTRVAAAVKAPAPGSAAHARGEVAWSQFVQAITTTSDVNVRGAVVRGVDLSKVISSAGTQRGGETALDTLSGKVATRGAPPSLGLQLTGLQAKSGVLGVSGNVALAETRALSGQLNVDASVGGVGGLVAVPVQVAGTLDSPSVSLSRATMLGAAIGSAILPGAGTAAGAKYGDKLGSGVQSLKEKLFGK
jgi:hypothetical protein